MTALFEKGGSCHSFLECKKAIHRYCVLNFFKATRIPDYSTGVERNKGGETRKEIEKEGKKKKRKREKEKVAKEKEEDVGLEE